MGVLPVETEVEQWGCVAALRMGGRLQLNSQMEWPPAVATDYCSHLCFHVQWDLMLGVHNHLKVWAQDNVQQGSRSNLMSQYLQLAEG